MTIIQEFYSILCEQTGTKASDFERYGIEEYIKEGWLGEESLEKAIKTLVWRRTAK